MDKKISEETILTRDNTERIPVIQSDGSGGWVNGVLEISDADSNVYNSDGSLNSDRSIDGSNNSMSITSLSDLLIQGSGDIGFEFDESISFKVNNAPSGLVPGMSIEFNSSLDSEILINIYNGTDDLLRLYGSGKASIKKGLKVGDETVLSNAVMFEVISTLMGTIPFPLMNETQRNAISSPTNYSGILNTTRGKKEIYHPTFGWIGEDLSLCMSCATTSSVTSSTYYFSMAGGLALRSTIAGLAIRPTKKGKITKASFTRFIASTLGNRSYSLYVRINDTTDYLVATQGTTATETFFENSALNTTGIPVDVTDSIVMKLVVSGGTTDSANVLFFGHLVIN